MIRHNPQADTDARAAELMRIMNAGVHHAQQRNRKLGVANVYSINGTLYYELPDGTLSRTDPDEVEPKSTTAPKAVDE